MSLTIGTTFKADNSLKAKFPESERWVLVHELADHSELGGEKINNLRRHLWIASPVGYEGKHEVLCCMDCYDEADFQPPPTQNPDHPSNHFV